MKVGGGDTRASSDERRPEGNEEPEIGSIRDFRSDTDGASVSRRADASSSLLELPHRKSRGSAA